MGVLYQSRKLLVKLNWEGFSELACLLLRNLDLFRTCGFWFRCGQFYLL